MSSPASPHTDAVRWTGSISHLHYVGRWFLILLFLAAAAGSFFYAPAEQFEQIWIARGALILAAVLLALWVHFDRVQRRYTITEHRVIVEYGVISRRSNEIRLRDVRSINLARSGLPGMLGVGRLEFSSAATDDADVIFWNVPEAEKLRDLVRSLQSPELNP